MIESGTLPILLTFCKIFIRLCQISSVQMNAHSHKNYPFITPSSYSLSVAWEPRFGDRWQ
jgi:hypothetical protein